MLPFPAAGWAPSLPTSGMQHSSGPWSSQVSSIPHHTQCYIPNQRLANRITMEFPPRLKARICFGSSCCIWISTSWLKQVLQRQKPAKRAADAQACREADSTQETNKPSHTWASKLCRLHTLKFSAFSPKMTCAHRSFSPASSPSPWRPPCAQLFVNKITARCLNPRHSLSPNKHFHMIVLFQHYQKIHLSPSSCFTQAAQRAPASFLRCCMGSRTTKPFWSHVGHQHVPWPLASQQEGFTCFSLCRVKHFECGVGNCTSPPRLSPHYRHCEERALWLFVHPCVRPRYTLQYERPQNSQPVISLFQPFSLLLT